MNAVLGLSELKGNIMNVVSLHNETLNSILKDDKTQILQEPVKASNDPVIADAKPSNPEEIYVAATQSELSKKINALLKCLIPPMIGILLFMGLWSLIAQQSKVLPGPIATFHSGVVLFAHPFYINSLNDQGIGWNILSSLQRVGLGFGLAAQTNKIKKDARPN